MCTEQQLHPLHCLLHAGMPAQQLLFQTRCTTAEALP
jgi:hypothetical protein